MLRTNCAICKYPELNEFLIIKKMPVFMGVTDVSTSGELRDMIFCECTSCNNIQLKELLDLEVVYSSNHNTETVGDLWKNHYSSFLNFIGDKFVNKNVLEIGDPSAKIAKLTDVYRKWIIIEKNPNFESDDKIIFINKFFEEDFQIDDQIDVIVHSHFFEHLYEPITFLKKCHEILCEDGEMFFSIPDLRHFLEGDFLPNSILQFEHTYFIDETYVKYLCENNGFTIVKTHKYRNHSVFFHLKKTTLKNSEKIITDRISQIFINKYKILRGRISLINQSIKNDYNVFLYGAHVTSQSYLFNGLSTSKIIGLIDGSNKKIGKYLYGTNFKTFEPDIIKNYEQVTVICSHMGIYKDEISKNLISINSRVKIL